MTSSAPKQYCSKCRILVEQLVQRDWVSRSRSYPVGNICDRRADPPSDLTLIIPSSLSFGGGLKEVRYLSAHIFPMLIYIMCGQMVQPYVPPLSLPTRITSSQTGIPHTSHLLSGRSSNWTWTMSARPGIGLGALSLLLRVFHVDLSRSYESGLTSGRKCPLLPSSLPQSSTAPSARALRSPKHSDILLL